MKKSIIYSLLLAALAFVACDPIEDRDAIGGAITAADLDISASPLVINGVNTNKVILKNYSPVLPSWNYGVGVTTKNVDTVLMVVEGTSTISFTGLNPNGVKITKEIDVDVEDLYFPVPPQWGYLCGSGEKEWVWDENHVDGVFGNGGYLGNTSPGWWKVYIADIEGQAEGEGDGASMVFSTNGATLTKKYNTGGTAQGTFSFDMSQTTDDGNGGIWAEGMLYTKGVTVLCGKSINEGGIDVYNYDILSLDDNNMALSYHAEGTGAWGEAWFWMFRAAD
ncbi:hypothetical protein [Carboxylicivirga linearis]|uniref:Lipoprotein n=1 Tax=Carboxylicivirga linearis TaxID=1628157 RepID=A0ABS5JUZ8_9BACT|nr:hypothetical protein [Carboxylicivirga linearis]MBS2098296.1 hypothetical protein [Carboxylicivirga linearis]